MDNHDNCHVEPLDKPIDQAALSTSRVATLTVSGMGCPRCATRVRNGLLRLEGVLLADVLPERGVAAATFDPNQVKVENLMSAVTGAGNDDRHFYKAQFLGIMPADEVYSIAP